MQPDQSELSAEAQWYTRREGVVRGPFAAAEIARYLLLGRIRLGDELRCQEQAWSPVSHHADLVPEEMQLPPTPENEQRLQRARLAADERQGADRRSRNPDPGPEILERRSGTERRHAEPAEAMRFRQRAAAGIDSDTVSAPPAYAVHHRLVIGLALVLGVLLLLWGTSSAWD